VAERAALITGGSSGIGLAIARALGEDGYGLTVSARKPDKLEAAVKELDDSGFDVHAVPANMADEEDIKRLAEGHRERYGRLDVLANNAGVGIGGAIADAETKKLDMQLDVNLRAVYLMTREAIPLLKEAGAEHGKALIVNTASIAGKFGQGWLAAYSATKFGVVGLSQAMHKELGGDGIQVTALCPGFVATNMTDWVQEQVPKEEMIQPEDIAEGVRFLLSTSPNCFVPELQFIRPGDSP
jgi:NAD(P)-dependent dehydrogenase (short-subunit alcohol dehydrogenase family)